MNPILFHFQNGNHRQRFEVTDFDFSSSVFAKGINSVQLTKIWNALEGFFSGPVLIRECPAYLRKNSLNSTFLLGGQPTKSHKKELARINIVVYMTGSIYQFKWVL